jgi:leucyl aminopeptidase
MEFHATEQTILTWSGDCLVIGLTEASIPIAGELAELNTKVSGLLQELIDEAEFTGKARSTAVIRVGSQGAVRKLGLVGLGAADQLNAETLRQAAAAAARLAKAEKCSTLGLSLPMVPESPALSIQAMVEGATLALHQDKRFKSDDENGNSAKVEVETVALLGAANQAESIQVAQAVCEGVVLARRTDLGPG